MSVEEMAKALGIFKAEIDGFLIRKCVKDYREKVAEQDLEGKID